MAGGRTAPMDVPPRGLVIPKTMNALLAETIEKKGVDAAIAQYRELRKNSLGDGQYDFGKTSLNILTESLLMETRAKRRRRSWS